MHRRDVYPDTCDSELIVDYKRSDTSLTHPLSLGDNVNVERLILFILRTSQYAGTSLWRKLFA